eukprot:6202095-Pleurochrysis_carterae.AAC.1
MCVCSDAVNDAERESDEKTHQIAAYICASPRERAKACVRVEIVVTCVRAGQRRVCSLVLRVVECESMKAGGTDANAVWRVIRSMQVKAPAAASTIGAMCVMCASEDVRGSSWCAAKRVARVTHVLTRRVARRRKPRSTVQHALSWR